MSVPPPQYPSNGVGNVRSEVLLAVWDQFQKAGIEIPYPQQDIHVRGLPEALLAKGLASKGKET